MSAPRQSGIWLREERRDRRASIRAVAQVEADRAEVALRLRAKALRLRALSAQEDAEKAAALAELHGLPSVADEWRRVYLETRGRLEREVPR